jgi:hypothetical protein
MSPLVRAIRRRFDAMWPLDKIVADLASGDADQARIANLVRSVITGESLPC